MSMLFKRIKDWATSITAFRTGDVIPVDGPSGTAKMSKDALLALVALPDGTYPDMTAGVAKTLPYGSASFSAPTSGPYDAILAEIQPPSASWTDIRAVFEIYIVRDRIDADTVPTKCGNASLWIRSQNLTSGSNYNYGFELNFIPNHATIPITVSAKKSNTNNKLFLVATYASDIRVLCSCTAKLLFGTIGADTYVAPWFVTLYPSAYLEDLAYLVDVPNSAGIGDTSTPIYVDTDGSLKPCNIRFISVSGSWTAPNVSGDAKFTLYNDSGSSVSLVAGSLSKLLLDGEYCDLLAVNGTWKTFSNSYI